MVGIVDQQLLFLRRFDRIYSSSGLSYMDRREKIRTTISIILMEITIIIVCLLCLVPAYSQIINADYNVLGGVKGLGTSYNKEVTLVRDYNDHQAGTVFTAYRISFDGQIISSDLEPSGYTRQAIPFDYVAEQEDLTATANAMLDRMDEYVSARKAYMLYTAIGFGILALLAPFISIFIRKKRISRRQQDNE